MDVELLVIEGCANELAAAVLLRTALDDVGLGATEVRTTVVTTLQEAERRGFIGSPTVLLDGADPFPEPAGAAALACRLYRTPAGSQGVPPLPAVRQALKRAADLAALERP